MAHGTSGSIWTAHPAKAGQTYWQHAAFATRVMLTLAAATCALACHAVFPFAFPYTASERVRRVYGVLAPRYGWKD